MQRFIEAMMYLAIGSILGTATARYTYGLTVMDDWETLLVGILAVGAAFVTVSEMRRADLRQGERHDQLMRLNLRSDALAAERAATQADDLLEWIARAEEFCQGLGEVYTMTDQAAEAQALNMADIVQGLMPALDHDDIRSARGLFDGTTAQLYSVSREIADRMRYIGLPGLRTTYPHPRTPAMMREELAAFVNLVSTEKSVIADFAERLKSLAEEYG